MPKLLFQIVKSVKMYYLLAHRNMFFRIKVVELKQIYISHHFPVCYPMFRFLKISKAKFEFEAE